MKKLIAAALLVLVLMVRKLWARTQDAPPEQASIVAGKVATYTGAGAAVASGLSLSDWGVVIGITVGVLGLLFGQYWARRKAKREDLERVDRKQREEEERAERRAIRERREQRDIAEHDAYLRRLERDTHPTAPMPLSCANDDEQERIA